MVPFTGKSIFTCFFNYVKGTDSALLKWKTRTVQKLKTGTSTQIQTNYMFANGLLVKVSTYLNRMV